MLEFIGAFYKYSTILLVCIIVIVLIGNGALTTLTIGNKVCLFSGFTGTITKANQPIKGAKVIRSYEWNNKKMTEVAVTDENGQFSFESVWATSRKVFVVQFVSHQQIFVEYDGEREQIWGGGKGLEEEFTEFGGKPINFTCNLGDEIRGVSYKIGFMTTNAHWNVDEATRVN